jgi:5-methylcytosine-specific restriction enzyme B
LDTRSAEGQRFTLHAGRPIWSDAVIGDLYEKFVENPDTGSRGFEEKFRDQLSEAGPDTLQLAGELLFVHFLPAIDISGDHERALIRTVLGWSSNPVAIPPDLAPALDEGFSATGVAFRTRRPFQLTFLLEFVKAWKMLSSSEQDRLLAAPWAFKEFVFALPIQGAQTQRCALLHLVHPDTFESITSGNRTRVRGRNALQ